MRGREGRLPGTWASDGTRVGMLCDSFIRPTLKQPPRRGRQMSTWRGPLRGVSILSASLKRRAASSSSQPAAPALPEVRSDRRWERRGRAALSHSFIPFSRCRWFMLAMRLLYINTDNAQQRAFEGFGRIRTAQEVMSAVSITEINERE